MRSAPAAYSAETPAVANAAPSLKSAPAALSNSALAAANSGIAARLRSAVEAEAGRMSGVMASNSTARSGASLGRSHGYGDGPAGSQAPITVRPNVNVNFTGDLAQLARVLRPVIEAEDTRVGAGI